jgi:beta-N-acetylhexosaminidase
VEHRRTTNQDKVTKSRFNLGATAIRKHIWIRKLKWRSSKKINILIVAILTFLPGNFSARENAAQSGHRLETQSKEEIEWVKRTLGNLTLEEKVGQMLQVRYYADYQNYDGRAYQLLRGQISKFHIGSVVFGMHFNNLGPVRSSPLDAAKVANQLQRDSNLPLLFAADIERGMASRLRDVPSFPWPMAWGAINDQGAIERFGLVTGREARAVGIHWALAPVSDVNSNPSNPVINVRSFGEDPKLVSISVAAFIRGAHEGGLLLTAKHFPGNGDTSVDAHREVASIDSNLTHLRETEFPPFQAAISVGVDAILLAHARVPALEPNPEKITTTSNNIIEGVLKGELGFKGVVITDALEMRGITKLYDPSRGSPTARAAVDAVKAGCDVLMIPTDLEGTFKGIIDAVRKHELSEARIDESAGKILQMKAHLGLYKNRFVDIERVEAVTSEPDDMMFAQTTTDKAVTLVRNNGKVLPMYPSVPGDKTLSGDRIKSKTVVILLAEAFEERSGEEFEREMKARRPETRFFRFDGRFSEAMTSQLLAAASEADQIVLATYVVHSAAGQFLMDGQQIKYFGLKGSSGRVFQEIVGKYPVKTVVIALGSPYLIENFPQIQTYICTYAMTSTSEVSAVKALFGEIQNYATLPVTLSGVAVRGSSLAWPIKQNQLSTHPN